METSEPNKMSSWSRTRVSGTAVVGGRGSEAQPRPPSFVPRPLPHNIVYATPACKDTAVVLAFFNPAKSFRIFQNLLYVLHQLERARIPWFVGELAYGADAAHQTAPAPNIFHFRSSSYMFSKENILEAVIRQPAVAAFSKYVIMDCDIVFEALDWVDAVSAALDTHDVVQPYQYATHLNISFQPAHVKTSIVSDSTAHPGYVWAFRRDWWERVGGLCEYALIGGGDVCLAHMVGVSSALVAKPYIADLLRAMQTGGGPPRVTFLPLAIWHLPHGSVSNRQYSERVTVLQNAMRTLHIDHLHDAVVRNADGMFEWKPAYALTMNALMLGYFKAREDDG